MRAAQYVRVSTDLQEYSIVNQQAAIAEYAAQNDFEIVKTYADSARSGLDIKHRPGLQRLIDDVVGGRADFQAVLVFDISRWGRFQDGDEAACYEFLCRRAGITIHYCAESFPNDGSSASAVLKMLKRMMAAEYSRELSAKTHAGQCRLAASGFKLGGINVFGLRRLLLDSDGRPKVVLQDGERKSLATERVTYTLGPEHEVSLVREIYSMFLDQDICVHRIARVLNERGVEHGKFGSWTHYAVRRILSHPKYAGCAVFNRTSEKLKSKLVHNPRELWVVCPNAFPAIVSQDTFDRAQAKLDNAVIRRSNARLLAELREYIQTHGKPLPGGAHFGDMASASTYHYRFGGRMRAYELIEYQPARYTTATLEQRRRVAALRLGFMADLRQAFPDAGVRMVEGKIAFGLRGRGKFLVEVARSYSTMKGIVRWRVQSKRLSPKYGVIVIRLQQGNCLVKDFVILPKAPKTAWGFWLSDELVSGAYLDGAGLSFCDATRTAFTGCRARGANFVNARYVNGWFLHADLTDADFYGCDLSASDFGRRYAELGDPPFPPAILANARFTKAKLTRTILRGVDLTTVRGLTKEQLSEAITDGNTKLPLQWGEEGDGNGRGRRQGGCAMDISRHPYRLRL